MAGGAVGGLAGASALGTLGDLGEAAIEGVVKLLTTPVVLEFGGDGLKVGGRRRSRKIRGGGQRYYDDRLMVKRLELPMGVLLFAAWAIGLWRPGALLAPILEGMFGPIGEATEAVRELGQLMLPGGPWAAGYALAQQRLSNQGFS